MTAFNPGDPVHVSFDGVAEKHQLSDGRVLIRYDTDYAFYVRPKHLSPVPTPVLFADIRVGDRIRAVHTGGNVLDFTVTGKHSGALWGNGVACAGDSTWQFFRLTPPEPPEPAYEVGAVYQDDMGATYCRLSDGWQDFNGMGYGHDRPTRPLVRLVPEEPK